MSLTTSQSSSREPAWDVARLFPDQGTWSVGDYLELTNSTNRLVEFDNGCIEVLEMPTPGHQRIVRFLFLRLHSFVAVASLGEVLFAPLRIHTVEEKYREPDVAFMRTENSHRCGDHYWTGADLVVEVVSSDSDSRMRDLQKKRAEYAAAGIPEYWIVDPQESRIIVLTLNDRTYAEHGSFEKGETASSVMLDGFAVNTSEVFAAAENK